MNRQSMQKLRLDRRLLERSHWISSAEREAELESLPDASHKAMTLGEAEEEAKGAALQPAAPAPEPEPTPPTEGVLPPLSE